MSIGKMTPEETEPLKRLCKRILEEQDQQKFNELVMELKLCWHRQSAVFSQSSANHNPVSKFRLRVTVSACA